VSSHRGAAVIGVIVALLVLALAGTAVARTRARSPKTVSTSTWVTSVCKDFTRWDHGLSARALPLPATDPIAGKAAIAAFVGEASRATDTLSRGIAAAKMPSLKHGTTIASSFAQAARKLRHSYRVAKTRAAALPTDDPTAFATAAQTLATDLERAGATLNTSLQKITSGDRSGKLAKAFRTTKACKAAPART